MQPRSHRYDEIKAARASRFALELSDVLHELRLTHKALASALGVTQHAVDSWTRGVDPSIPGSDNLDKLCALLEERQTGMGKRVAQAVGHTWEPDLPPPVALHALDEPVRTNLPHALTSFVGRQEDLAEISGLLKRHRLVTLTGPGGMGKTRLALELGGEIAQEYPGGVWLVELAPFNDPAILPQVVARALGLREQPAITTVEALVEHLRHKHLLILLDNCEHMIDDCAFLAVRLLKSCPRLSMVATSREPLTVQGEIIWRVPGLSLPASGREYTPAELASYEAVGLFVDRAGASQPRFKLSEENAGPVAEICRRLDGVPLSIELAAACVRSLTVKQIAKGLSDRFRLLEEGDRTVLPRHKTQRAAVDWSYELLSPVERTLFRRMSVFAGGWSLEGAEEVCPDATLPRQEVFGTLRRLVDKSLIQADMSGDEARYGMLETMREYGKERLAEADEVDTVARRHADYCLSLLTQMEASLSGPNRAFWFEKIETEYDNIRAALRWAIDHREAELALKFGGAGRFFWNSAGLLSEGRRWLEEALAVEGAYEAPPLVLTRALNGLGILCFNQGDNDAATRHYEEGLEVSRAAGMMNSVSTSVTNLGLIANRAGDHDKAWRYLAEGLALQREIGDARSVAIALHNLAEVPMYSGDYARALQMELDVLDVFRQMNDSFLVGNALDNLGLIYMGQHDYVEALKVLEEANKIYGDLKLRRGMNLVGKNLGIALLHTGELVRAERLLKEMLVLSREIEESATLVECLAGLAALAAAKGQGERAGRLAQIAEALLISTKAHIDLPEQVQYNLNLEKARTAQRATLTERHHGIGTDEAIAIALAE